MPVFTFDSIDRIPEQMRNYAKAVDGSDAVTLNLVAQDKLDEFRDRNTELVKERDNLKQQVEVLAPIVGEDPEAFKARLAEFAAMEQRVKDGSLKESRNVEEEVVRRTEDMRKTLEEQIRAAQKEGSGWKQKAVEGDSRYRDLLVNMAIKDAAIDPEAGVLPSAIPDILSRARAIWRAEDNGAVVAYKGDLKLYGADGASELTPKEWLSKLKEEAPFFFKGTQGGGAGGAGGEKVGTHGKTVKELGKMTAEQRLALANGENINAQLRKA